MKLVRIFLLATVAASCAFLLTPGNAKADGLTGTAGISWLYPNTGSAFATDTIAVGSSLACPGASPLCAGYAGLGNETFSVGTDTISYSVSDYPAATYAGATFNGFEFTDLTFASGESLAGFTLTTDIPGLTSSDVTFGSNFIEINMAGLPVDGDFTLTLIPGTSTATTPEPSTLLLLGVALLALIGFTRKKANVYA